MSPRRSQGKILLVEDTTSWAETFVDILIMVGEEREVVIVDGAKFRAQFNKSSDFDDIEFSVIDLELRAGSTPKRNDEDGRTRILPVIRKLAPWLPSGCISRYISAETPSSIVSLSLSDFDYFTPKGLLGEVGEGGPAILHSEFNPAAWKEILKKSQLKRIASITGQTVIEMEQIINSDIKFACDNLTKQQLDECDYTQDSFREALLLLGIRGTSLYVEAMQQGFSGQYASKVCSHGMMGGEPIDSYWMVKWGKPTRKLDKEARAHRELFLRGVDRALQIPQMNPAAIFWDGIGLLCYSFEKNAKSALSYIIEKGIGEFSKHIKIISQKLYFNKRKEHVDVLNELEKWTTLSKTEIEETILDKSPKACEVSWALIHGDLHLQNIFVKNDFPAIIDYGRAGFGPIVVDIAKMLVDTIVFAIKEPDDMPLGIGLEDLKSSKAGKMLDEYFKDLNAEDDLKLFQWLIRSYMKKYISYPDVPDEKRKWLLKYLQ